MSSFSPLFADDLPISDVTGLFPRAWIAVGQGFSREDVKGVLLRSGRGFIAEAVTTVPELCARLLGVSAERLLDSSGSSNALSRQEILRHLLSQTNIASYFPELKRLRRQRSFFRNVDRTLQSARLSFAHAEEAFVLSEFLERKVGPSLLKKELEGFSAAYEAWLEAGGWWDTPLLIKKTVELLENSGWPEHVMVPERIDVLSGITEESLERHFWETVSRSVEIRRIGPLANCADEQESGESSGKRWQWERWHTADDAADALADELSLLSPADWARAAVLIPDLPDIRRSLLRAFLSRKLPLADPRDPARLRKEEIVKEALLPLKTVAQGFRRADVLAWIRAFLLRIDPALPWGEWSSEISARGIRRGLSGYTGGKLAPLQQKLQELQSRFAGKLSCEAAAERHLEILTDVFGNDPAHVWVISFFQAQWESLASDLERVGLVRPASLAFWSNRLSSRIFDGTPPVDRFRPVEGVRIFRLQQFPLESSRAGLKLYLFGTPPQWHAEAVHGDYWLSPRDRELLSSEFPVRSGVHVRAERLSALRSWVSSSNFVHVYDFSYSFDGRERESLKTLLAELGAPKELLDTPVEKGCHSRWLPSYGVDRPEHPLTVALDPAPAPASGGLPEISATTLDRMSRCGFQALALQRWRLWDDKDPDTELWPEAKGNILHYAVKLLLQSRDSEGRFMLSCSEAIERAWREKPPKGLFRSQRVESYVRSRLVTVLETFREQEWEYWSRARTRTLSMEEDRYRLDFPEFVLVGEPDRVEEHPDGLFVMDYKTSSALPNGTQMLELGYRLQLPFYALAAERKYGKPVIGIQFIQLTRTGGRGSGIYFTRWNGKEAGKLTKARSNSKSLFPDAPPEIWARLEEQILDHARRYAQGRFTADPKKGADECKTCQAADLCGFRRRGEREDKEVAAGEVSDG